MIPKPRLFCGNHQQSKIADFIPNGNRANDPPGAWLGACHLAAADNHLRALECIPERDLVRAVSLKRLDVWPEREFCFLNRAQQHTCA